MAVVWLVMFSSALSNDNSATASPSGNFSYLSSLAVFTVVAGTAPGMAGAVVKRELIMLGSVSPATGRSFSFSWASFLAAVGDIGASSALVNRAVGAMAGSLSVLSFLSSVTWVTCGAALAPPVGDDCPGALVRDCKSSVSICSKEETPVSPVPAAELLVSFPALLGKGSSSSNTLFGWVRPAPSVIVFSIVYILPCCP